MIIKSITGLILLVCLGNFTFPIPRNTIPLLSFKQYVGWGCLRIGCWGEYLGLRGTRDRGIEKLHNEEVSDLYCLPNIVRVVKSRRIRWAGHVARMGEGERCTGFWWVNLRERDHWGDPDADGRIILRWIFRKWEGVLRTGWSWIRIGTGGGHLWVRWWTFGFQKCGEFLD